MTDLEQQIDRLHRQVVQLYQQGLYPQALKPATEVRDLTRQHLGEDHPTHAISLNHLATLYWGMGDYAAAEPLFQQARQIRRTALGEDHADYATSLNDLALLYKSMGNYAAAEPLYQQARQVLGATLGADHPDYATSLNNLAGLYKSMGNHAAAEPLYQQARQIDREALGDDHPAYATDLNNLGELYESMGKYAAAEPLYQRARDIRRAALGEDHPAYAASLNNLAMLYRAMGDYATAEPLYRRALDIRRAVLGEDHPHYAASLNNLALLHCTKGDYPAAEPLFQQAREIALRALGEDHPDYATSLNNLAELYLAMGNYPAAEPFYQQAREIYRATLGAYHPDYATSLNNLAQMYRAMGNYAAAEPLFQQARQIRRTALGEDHADYATSLNNLAVLYTAMGNFVAAEPLYRRALEIRQAALGEEHPDYATSLNNLALLHWTMGDSAAAEPLFHQAQEIDRRAFGADHPDYATDLNNLAGLYEAMGDYAAAEPLFQQARDIHRKALGADHPRYATDLNNLAGLYEAMGDYAAAEPLYQQAQNIRRVALGEDHPDYSQSLNNLAGLYKAMGNFAAAEPLYRKALEIVRTALGEDHPDYATSLNNLAGLYLKMGNYAAAEPFYLQARDIRRVALGEEHPANATSLNGLAALYWAMGNYAAVEPLYRKARDIRRAALGEEHPDYATSLNNLAGLYAATERAGDGSRLMQQAAAIEDRLIGQVFSLGSEARCLAYLHSIRGNHDAYLSLVSQHLSDSPSAVRWALNLLLRRKGLVAESLKAQRDAILGGKYPHLEPQLHELTLLRRQIAQKWFSGPGPEGLAAHQALLAEWTARKDHLEKELAPQIPEMALQQQLAAADRRAVALGLPERVALVEFVRFQVFEFKAVATKISETRWRPPESWQPARYLAFVLLKGDPDDVQMIDLGEAGPIDSLISLFRHGLAGDQADESNRGSMVALPEVQSASAGLLLRKAVFDPLRSALAGAKRLLLVPDGDLTRLPFEVLPTDDGACLLDGYEISYLATGRDVVRFTAEPTGQPLIPFIAANPDYDLADNADGDRRAGSLKPVDAATDRSPSFPASRSSRAPELAKVHFRPLPATKEEGETIAQMLGTFLRQVVDPLMEGRALETCLKAVRSPWILHLATHGFFLPDQPHDPGKGRRDLGVAGSFGGAGLGGGAALENPLLRSGLALASANWKYSGFRPPLEAEDGLLTAEDVVGLDLLNTELVVLSACDTGLGQVQVGEGVYGLRRAFVLAGARTLVMSLWKVPDKATQELMVLFYTNLLAGKGRAESLRLAQRELKKKEEYSHPLYWGAFICQGDPSPLPPFNGR